MAKIEQNEDECNVILFIISFLTLIGILLLLIKLYNLRLHKPEPPPKPIKPIELHPPPEKLIIKSF